MALPPQVKKIHSFNSVVRPSMAPSSAVYRFKQVRPAAPSVSAFRFRQLHPASASAVPTPCTSASSTYLELEKKLYQQSVDFEEFKRMQKEEMQQHQQQLNLQFRKMQQQQQQQLQQQQQQDTVETLQVGTVVEFNNYISKDKDQKKTPFYLVDSKGIIRCHCPGNPFAVHLPNRNGNGIQIKCAKLTRANGKCQSTIC